MMEEMDLDDLANATGFISVAEVFMRNAGDTATPVGGSRLTRDVRRRNERELYATRRMLHEMKRTQTLRRAMIPRTKLAKHELKRTRGQGVGSEKLLRRVEDTHAEMLETLDMQLEDPTVVAARGARDVYTRNYEEWEMCRVMAVAEAEAEDQRDEVRRKEDAARERIRRERASHARKLLPSLVVICPGFEPTPKRSPARVGGITGYFPRRPGANRIDTERRFRQFYFERVADLEARRINEWPAFMPREERPVEKPRGGCGACGNSDMVVDTRMGTLLCPRCGVLAEGGEGVGYKQTFSEMQQVTRGAAPYERMAHFKEFIVRLEGCERTEIPEIVVHALLRQCSAHGIDPITMPEKITYQRVREFLQRTNYAHFFENIPRIIHYLTKQPSMRLTPEEKDGLTAIFNEIQRPFERHKGKRKNFLSYSYTTYKSCELLGIHRFLPLLPLLKAPQNLLAADNIWKKICQDCNFEFIRTI